MRVLLLYIYLSIYLFDIDSEIYILFVLYSNIANSKILLKGWTYAYVDRNNNLLISFYLPNVTYCISVYVCVCVCKLKEFYLWEFSLKKERETYKTNSDKKNREEREIEDFLFLLGSRSTVVYGANDNDYDK